MALINISRVFQDAANGVLNAAAKVLPIVSGVTKALETVSNRYIITITARRPAKFSQVNKVNTAKPDITINAYLQDKFTFKVESSWEPVQQMSIGDIPDSLVQFITGGQASLHSTITTRRKWRGSSPIELTFRLKFESYDDTYVNVILPCLFLQELVLPSGGLKTVGEQLFVTPPGPSPYVISKDAPSGTIIDVNIGGFAFFDSVIIKSAEIIYDNRMSADGPIGATANIIIETYEMLTREKLEQAYHRSIDGISAVAGLATTAP